MGKGHFGVKDEWLSCVEEPGEGISDSCPGGSEMGEGSGGNLFALGEGSVEDSVAAGRGSSQSLGPTALFTGSHRRL